MSSTGTNFDKLLNRATSQLLMGPDWPSILTLCDLICQNDVQPKYALSSVKKKLFSKNQFTALFALLVLKSMVKNCGYALHEELTTRLFCDTLYELAKTTPHEILRQKLLLELIQAWNFAFHKNPKHDAFKDTMMLIKSDGFKFPALCNSPPEWADGDVCHRCRVTFSLLQRKQHCRACGQVFCGQCTQKTTTLPKYGIEKEVRVCDACYDQTINRPNVGEKYAVKNQDTELPKGYFSSLKRQRQTVPRKSEEEDLQLATAPRQSAPVEEKEVKGASNNSKHIASEDEIISDMKFIEMNKDSSSILNLNNEFKNDAVIRDRNETFAQFIVSKLKQITDDNVRLELEECITSKLYEGIRKCKNIDSSNSNQPLF